MSEARQFWSERLARYRVSHQTVVAFCEAERVFESNFYRWKAKLARSSPKMVPIQLSPRATVSVPEGDRRLELVLPSGTLLRLPTDFAIERLATLLNTWHGTHANHPSHDATLVKCHGRSESGIR